MTGKVSVNALAELIDFIEEGGSPFSDEAERLQGQTDCEDGCTVEPDATCPHGWDAAELSLLRTQP